MSDLSSARGEIRALESWLWDVPEPSKQRWALYEKRINAICEKYVLTYDQAYGLMDES